MYFVAFEASVAQSEHSTVFVNILVNMDQGYKKPWTLDCDVLKTKYHPETFLKTELCKIQINEYIQSSLVEKF